MTKEPYIYSGAFEGVLALLEGPQWKLSCNSIMQAAGLAREDLYLDDNRVALRAFALFLEKASEITGNNALVFDLMEAIEQYAGSLVHYAFRQSPTVRDAMQIGVRYSGLIISFKVLGFEEKEKSAYFNWENYEKYDEFQQFPFWTPARVVTMLRSALGREWTPVEVSLQFSQPQAAESCFRMFGSDVQFNQPQNYIKLTEDELNQKMPARDEQLWQGLIQLSDKVMRERAPEPAVVGIVRQQIISALPGEQVNVRLVAEQMARSPRTLQRELQTAGTSFSALLEDVRRSMAVRYLSDTDLHISQIAFLLGFSEVSVFTRAVNRWFDLTPSAFRKKYQNKKKQA